MSNLVGPIVVPVLICLQASYVKLVAKCTAPEKMARISSSLLLQLWHFQFINIADQKMILSWYFKLHCAPCKSIFGQYAVPKNLLFGLG